MSKAESTPGMLFPLWLRLTSFLVVVIAAPMVIEFERQGILPRQGALVPLLYALAFAPATICLLGDYRYQSRKLRFVTAAFFVLLIAPNLIGAFMMLIE